MTPYQTLGYLLGYILFYGVPAVMIGCLIYVVWYNWRLKRDYREHRREKSLFYMTLPNEITDSTETVRFRKNMQKLHYEVAWVAPHHAPTILTALGADLTTGVAERSCVYFSWKEVRGWLNSSEQARYPFIPHLSERAMPYYGISML